MARLFFTPQAVRIDTSGAPYAGAKANFYLTGTTTQTDTYTDNALTTTHANPVVADAGGQFAAIYLDPSITYRVIITDSNDVQLDDIDPCHSPLTAADIAIVDSGGYYAGTNLETVLADLGANYLKKTGGTMTGDITLSGADIQAADNEIIRPVIGDYGIKHAVVTQSDATPGFDIAGNEANSFTITLTENATFSFSNPSASGTFCEIHLRIVQGAGSYTVTWPASVLWPGGTAPTISTGSGAVDDVTLWTIDGGTTWHGNFSQAYA